MIVLEYSSEEEPLGKAVAYKYQKFKMLLKTFKTFQIICLSKHKSSHHKKSFFCYKSYIWHIY